MLTEEGLPNFHRLIATHLGEDTVWREWNNLWTAEEDRHGTVLRDYLVHTRQVDMKVVDTMQYEYIRQGFYPDWKYDPYRLLAYTVLQEKATQFAHANTAGILMNSSGVLAKVLGKIAAEEGRHHRFYLAVFSFVLELDEGEALRALDYVIRDFRMPGENIPRFVDYEHLARRAGIFTTGDYKKVVEDTIDSLGLASRRCVGEDVEKIRERILRYPKLLERGADRYMNKESRSISFPFLPGQELTI
jgi:acyl-[acyl-carrier-protein] desaturase